MQMSAARAWEWVGFIALYQWSYFARIHQSYFEQRRENMALLKQRVRDGLLCDFKIGLSADASKYVITLEIML